MTVGTGDREATFETLVERAGAETWLNDELVRQRCRDVISMLTPAMDAPNGIVTIECQQEPASGPMSLYGFFNLIVPHDAVSEDDTAHRALEEHLGYRVLHRQVGGVCQGKLIRLTATEHADTTAPSDRRLVIV